MENEAGPIQLSLWATQGSLRLMVQRKGSGKGSEPYVGCYDA